MRAWWVRVTTWVVLAAAAGLVAFCVAWRAEGGRWERVQTPSMGAAAPVGTLLWVKPVPFSSLTVGEFITFHPPGHPGVTYSHRVYAIDADHTITTKGVIPGPDPWRLTAGDVVGRVEMRWWGAGWLVTVAPVLIIGGLVAAGICALVRQRWKLPVATVLASVVLTVAIVWYRPFVNADQVTSAPAAGGGMQATYVGTGLLPVRIQAPGGAPVQLRAGQLGSIHAPGTAHTLQVRLAADVPWVFWAALVALCFLPAMLSLAPRRARAPATD